jgi:antitoxin (DNA-binding transcriptional repressor) of toxin-antitoxin stability system
LIHQLAQGEEIIITENQHPVAKSINQMRKPQPGLRPPPGLGKGCITIVSEDDEHLKDFRDYMS